MKALALCLIPMLSLFAPAQANTSPAWQAAYADYELATAGVGGGAERATQKFALLLATEPGNPLYLAHHGSSQAMQARDTMNPFKKMSFAENGIAELDRALALLAPEHQQAGLGGLSVAQQVKLVAASTYAALPGFFNRRSTAAKLLKELFDDPQLAQRPAAYVASLHLAAARLAQEENDRAGEVAQLKKAAALPAPQAAQARSRLAELKQ